MAKSKEEKAALKAAKIAAKEAEKAAKAAAKAAKTGGTFANPGADEHTASAMSGPVHESAEATINQSKHIQSAMKGKLNQPG